MLASVRHILPLTTVRRERVLPVSGKVLVRKGQKVSPTDPVAEANLYPEHLLLDLARGLGIKPSKADQYMQVEAGTSVAAGDLLAGPVGVTRRVVRAPKTGRVVVAGSGQILLEVQKPPFALRSGLSGDVVELVSDRGAIVETVGALIQGVWGNGQINYGLMYSLAKSPSHELVASQLDVSLRGTVVLAGYCQDADALKTATELPLRGLVLSSLSPELEAAALGMPIPVIVLEGFGRQPFNETAYKLLVTNERREVSLNAERWDPYSGVRPEVVIPLPADGAPALPRDATVFTAGQPVRINHSPYFGKTGTLVELPGTATLSNGVRAPAGVVNLGGEENIILPLSNLEVLA